MNTQEISKVLGLLETAFGTKRFYAETDKERVIYLWSVIFKDDDAIEVNRAVINCLSTLQFPPTIADIKMRMAQARMAGQMTEMEAFQRIKEAVSDVNSGRQYATDAYAELPPILKKLCGNAMQLKDWARVSSEKFETVIASNIMRSYEKLAMREADFYAMPKQLQESEQWRIEGPDLDALPAPEQVKYEKPEWMIRREELGDPDVTEKRRKMLEDFKGEG